jgi:hypothetical protein
VKRRTYCAVERPENQVKGFFEDTASGSTAAPTITSSSFSLTDAKSQTIFVGIIPRGSEDNALDDSFDLLNVHSDGQVRRFTADLKKQRWNVHHSEFTNASTGVEVSAAFLAEFDDVQRSLFKKRPDLAALALGDVSAPNLDNPSVLLMVSHPAASKKVPLSNVKVHIFSVPAQFSTDGLGIDESQKLRHLNTVSIPQVENVEIDSEDVQWSFHSGSAGLGLSFRDGFINFDLSQYSPTVSTQIHLPGEQFSSIMRISPHSVIGAGKSHVALYDTQHSSIQRSIASQDLLPNTSSKDVKPKTPVRFVGYFSKLGIALATKGNALLALDLSSLHTVQGTSAKRQRDGLLIDAIGRGVGSSSIAWDASADKHRNETAMSLGLNTQEEVERWNLFKQQLEDSAKANNAIEFDTAVKSYFGTSDQGKISPTSKDSMNAEKVLFVLSKLFAVKISSSSSAESSTSLKMNFWPKVSCNWLIESGHMIVDHIGIALRRTSKPQILPPLRGGTFVQALVEVDPSLQLLAQTLKGPVILKPEELAHALKIYLDLARSRSMLLDEPRSMTITDGGVDVPQNDSRDTSSSSIEPSLEDAFVGLNLTLSQLHKHPLPRVVASFRSTLSNTDTLSIVHHLRVSLATGGYTSRFTEEPPVPLEAIKAAPPLPLSTIIDLMNASVDAIGPSGWISAVEFAGSAANEAEVISHMQSEVSAALAGVEEAIYMKGILGEILRYGHNLQSHSSASQAGGRQADVAVVGSTAPSDDGGKYTTLDGNKRARITHERDTTGVRWETYTFPKAGEEDGTMLPLSLKAPESDVSRTKIQKSTGEVRHRTTREIAYLRRQQVPEYSTIKILF